MLIDKIKKILTSIKKEDLKTLKKNKINISINSTNISIKEMKFKERINKKIVLEKHEQIVIKEAKQKVEDMKDLMNIGILLRQLKEEINKAKFIGIDVNKTKEVKTEFIDIAQLFNLKLLEIKNGETNK